MYEFINRSSSFLEVLSYSLALCIAGASLRVIKENNLYFLTLSGEVDILLQKICHADRT